MTSWPGIGRCFSWESVLPRVRTELVLTSHCWILCCSVDPVMTGVTVLISHSGVYLQRRSVSVLAEEWERRDVQDGGPGGRAGEGYVQRERSRNNLWCWTWFSHRGQLPHKHPLLLRSRLHLQAPRRLHVQHSTGPVPPGGVVPLQMWWVRGVCAAVAWCTQPGLFPWSARFQTSNPRWLTSRTRQ